MKNEDEDYEIEFPESAVETAPASEIEPVAPTAQDPLKSFLDDPYEFEQCTITAQIVLLPDDGSERGREVMVGVRNHQDPYILQVFRLADLALPEQLLVMFGELREQLPARAVAKAMRDAEKQAKKQTVAVTKQVVTKPAQPPAPAKPAVAQKYAGKKPTADQLALFGKI